MAKNKQRKPLTPGQKHWLSLIGAYLASVGIPIATCAFVFPVEIVQETRLSIGASLIITAIISLSVFRSKLKKMFENYTVIMGWVVVHLICALLKPFIDEMWIISGVAIGANIGATPLFKIAESNGELSKAIKVKKQENKVNEMLGGKL